ncbi:hypothetical protein RvVAR031_26840 [Agrobacterium vitis]|nr:hypothetical protein RvVAR031_26840 [Agrobacterium vitis]
MVEHFVSLTVIFSSKESENKVAMNKNFHLSLISGFTLIITLVLVVGGVYLVSFAGDRAIAKIDMFGAALETNSVGVACFGLAAFTFYLTIRSIVSKI